MAPNRIAELSTTISINTRKVDDYLTNQNLPTPSLDENASAYPVPDDAPTEIKEAAMVAAEACNELNALMTGPRELVRFNWTAWVSVKAILRFKLDESFPVGEETTFQAMSDASGLTPRMCARLVRHAIINHRFFREPKPGVIVHSGLTAVLSKDKLVRNALAFMLDEFWPAGVKTADAMEKWKNSEESNETGFSLANGTNKGMYAYLADYPERGAKFGLVMSNIDEKREFLLDGFDWENVKTMVDVGGSHGSIPISIAGRFPHIKCWVQDLPEVVEEGKARLPENLQGNIEFTAHDFFTPQPQTADVYYFRSIFHNWSDKYCVQILQNLIPALKTGARIIIHERMLPSVDMMSKMSPLNVRRAVNMDIGMLQLFNSNQRTKEEWIQLIQGADERFEFTGAEQPKGAVRWIIVARWSEGKDGA